MKKKLNLRSLRAYEEYLKENEKAPATVAKYHRDISSFLEWNSTGRCSKETIRRYKNYLTEHFQITSVNSMLVSINGYLKFCGHSDWCVRLFKIQRRTFLAKEKEMTREEYYRLLKAAGEQTRIRMVIETIAATGIRVSELASITVEAVSCGYAEIDNKGKHRTVLLNSKLRAKLRKYAKQHRIRSGSVFVTRSGKPLDRSNIWTSMKALCEKADVARSKVFPHNLRHLFAKSFYSLQKDISRLADVLGHSSINTTRLYISSSGREHREQIEAMNLIL